MQPAQPPQAVVAVLGATADEPPPGLGQLPAGVRLAWAATPAELPGALAGADGLLVWDYGSQALAAAWPAANALRWIHVAAAGVEKVLIPEVVGGDVVVTNSRGVFDGAMAEYALGLLLAIRMDLPTTVRDQVAVRWRHRQTHRLAGSRVVVCGAGGIGRAIAELVQAVGCAVDVVGRTRRADPELDTVHGTEELPELLPRADFVVLALPLTPATRDLVGGRELGALKPTAWLVNLGRGAVVDEDALVEALRTGRIGGAALDVFDSEPLPADHPFWTLSNVIVSPHMSGDFAGHQRALSELFLDQLERYRRGTPLRNVVDKRLGFVP